MKTKVLADFQICFTRKVIKAFYVNLLGNFSARNQYISGIYLKSNVHLLKICLKKFIFSKVVESFTKTWNSSHTFFQVIGMILKKSVSQICYEWLLAKRVGFVTKSP